MKIVELLSAIIDTLGFFHRLLNAILRNIEHSVKFKQCCLLPCLVDVSVNISMNMPISNQTFQDFP